MKREISLFILCGIIILGVCGCGKKEKTLQEKCQEFTDKLQVYIDNKDYESFENGWFDHEDLTSEGCDKISCSCPSAWNLFLENKKSQASDLLEKGLVSSAYDKLGSNYIDNESLKDFYEDNSVFKLISSKQKEAITGIYASFGEWEWKHQVGSDFKFNKNNVYYGSSTLSLRFDNYFDKVLISGHLSPKNHSNWNSERNISVNYYNYKVLDNKIYLKAENEDDSQYDALFEIVSITDTELKLKLLINTTDVNAGQVYTFNYVRG